jgi:alkaline phosphatase D
MFGSCALLTTGFWRAFFPGADVRIYRKMAKAPKDFMVWLGDNLYYLGKDYTSYDRMFQRNIDVRRKFKLMRRFLAAQPNYAIWDDHDYGWNDADRTFPLKDTALKVFRGFWPNTYESDVKLTYFTFRYADAEFFMTDGRWYRSPPGDTAGDFLGPEQLRWLKEKLLNSTATFKFICMGSQVLNDNEHGESYAHYPHERNDLLSYIADNNIKGVIFLTGDKHYAELSRREWRGYPFYDFTSSPITSPVMPRKWLRSYHNPLSVKGTVIYRKNYGRISISGPPGSRSLRLALYGKSGRLKWDRTIRSDELSRK